MAVRKLFLPYRYNKIQTKTLLIMELNKEINVEQQLLDVSQVSRIQRILFFPERRVAIVKCDTSATKRDLCKKYQGVNVKVLTRSQAPRQYPKYFADSTKPVVELDKRTILFTVSPEQYQFCCQQGNISEYLRRLINREMIAASNGNTK